jgi:hypothetical protein
MLGSPSNTRGSLALPPGLQDNLAVGVTENNEGDAWAFTKVSSLYATHVSAAKLVVSLKKPVGQFSIHMF